MTDMIYNHITVRIPGTEHLLINLYGLLYKEITASSLAKIDVEGNIIWKPDTDYGINNAGYVIHGAIHKARPDVACVIHTHTRAGMAVSSMKCGLLPLNQTSIRFHGHIGYHDYEGPAINLDERERLVRDLGEHDAMIMRSHGLLTCGPTVPQAFNTLYQLEMSCRAQVDAMAARTDLDTARRQRCWPAPPTSTSPASAAPTASSNGPPCSASSKPNPQTPPSPPTTTNHPKPQSPKAPEPQSPRAPSPCGRGLGEGSLGGHWGRGRWEGAGSTSPNTPQKFPPPPPIRYNPPMAAPTGGIDCDIHPALPGTAALLPYLEPYWREQITIRGIDGLDLASYPAPHPRQRPPGLAPRRPQKPGADFARLRPQALDAFGSRFAICNVPLRRAGPAQPAFRHRARRRRQ